MGYKPILTNLGEEEACMAVLNNFYGDGKLKCQLAAASESSLDKIEQR